jgi:molecular chaperone GrpE (heat shock protein)
MVLSQNEMKSEIKEALESMEQKISWLWANSTSEENTLEKQLVEKREQQKKELQSQIEALQAEMENL